MAGLLWKSFLHKPIGGLQSLEIQKDNGMSAMTTRQKVLSSNMAATPLSFGSLCIGCKPPIDSVEACLMTTCLL